VARPKKAKQRQEPESLVNALDDIESGGDRLTEWVLANPQLILGTGLAILVVAGIWAFARSTTEASLESASAALGAVQAEYRVAMGATADDFVVAEPANPEIARRVREEYLDRFGEVADAHAGTAGGAVAGLERGILQDALGSPEEALSTWQAAAAALGADSPLSAFLELRIAALHEAAGRWSEAAQAFERAASIESFPLRHTARAEAARCHAAAGDVDKALAAFEQVKRDDPNGFLPEHLESRLLELKIRQRLN
jgi:tetratricopeptide (TPR) repeat protein